MEEDVSWQESVGQAIPLDEESDSEKEFNREVKHGEAGIGYEALEDSLLFPCIAICENTEHEMIDVKTVYEWSLGLLDLNTYP